eukprot:5731205-Lingulodinium_polyedra.AAC.1
MVGRLRAPARTQAERARARAGVGALRDARITKPTLQRYLWAAQRFCHWLTAIGLGFALGWDELEKAL